VPAGKVSELLKKFQGGGAPLMPGGPPPPKTTPKPETGSPAQADGHENPSSSAATAEPAQTEGDGEEGSSSGRIAALKDKLSRKAGFGFIPNPDDKPLPPPVSKRAAREQSAAAAAALVAVGAGESAEKNGTGAVHEQPKANGKDGTLTHAQLDRPSTLHIKKKTNTTDMVLAESTVEF